MLAVIVKLFEVTVRTGEIRVSDEMHKLLGITNRPRFSRWKKNWTYKYSAHPENRRRIGSKKILPTGIRGDYSEFCIIS